MAPIETNSAYGLRLAHFPVEVLRIITSHLPGYYIVRLLHLSGFKVLWSKLQALGVETVRLDSTVSQLSDIQRAVSLRGLRELVLMWSGQPKMDLKNLVDILPGTLAKLSIEHEHAESVWFRELTDSEKLDVRFFPFHHSGLTVVNFGSKFPNLDYLWLKGYFWNTRWASNRERWTSAMQCLFLRLLPRGLTFLHMENLENVFSFPFYDVLPPHLTHLSCRAAYYYRETLPAVLPTSLLESLKSLTFYNHSSSEYDRPQWPHHLASLSLAGSYQPPLPNLTHLRLTRSWGSTFLNDEFSAHGIPHTITHLQLEHSNLSSDAQFPPCLRSLQFNTSLSWTHFKNLPPSLESLDITVLELKPHSDWTTLPRALTELKFRQTTKTSKVRLCGLSPEIRSLDLDASEIDSENMRALPRELTRLRVDSEIPADLRDMFISLLPPKVIDLNLNWTILNDYDYTKMPKTLSRVQARGVYCTGLLLPPHITHFKMPKKVYFYRQTDGSVSFQPSETLTGSSEGTTLMDYNPKLIRLPSSLTSLDTTFLTLSGSEAELSLFLQLKSLRIASLSNNSKLTMFQYLVSLESLHVESGLQSDTPVHFPPNLTSLRIPVSNTAAPTLPPKLRSLTVSRLPLTFMTPLTALTSLCIHTPLTPENIQQLPTSITQLVRGTYCFTQTKVPIRDICRHLKDLVELDYRGSVTDEDLQWILDNTKLEIVATEDTPNILHPDVLLCEKLVEITDDLSLAQRTAFGLKYPCWKYRPAFAWPERWNTHLDIPKWQTIAGLLSPTLTTLKISSFTLPPKFGRCLPQTLTALDASETQGLDQSTTRSLPRSLVDLKIAAKGFSRYSITQIPRGVTSLTLKQVKKFWPVYASALPPQLLTLHLDVLRISNATIAALPRSITTLGFEESARTLTVPALMGLPPSITSLSGFFPNITAEQMCPIVQRFSIRSVTLLPWNLETEVKNILFNKMLSEHAGDVQAVLHHSGMTRLWQ